MHVYVLYTTLNHVIFMRDKADATVFDRSIDRSHHSNIRTVIPPTIDKFLNSPDKIRFTIEGKRVIIVAVKK